MVTPRPQDPPLPWAELPSRVRNGIRAALAETRALARHHLVWHRDDLHAIQAAILAEYCGMADEPPPLPAVVATLTAGQLMDQRNFGDTSLLQVREWLMGHGLDLASREQPAHDPLTANVYADWLEDNGEPGAAAKLRVAFPLDDGSGME